MPELGEVRVRDVNEDDVWRPEYWVRERYEECNCPVCEEEAHWIQHAGSLERGDVELPGTHDGNC